MVSGAFQHGSSFAGYTLVELLGRGGMGTVYRAQDATGRSVALKCLTPGVLSKPELVARFEREALAARSLAYPNLVTVLGAGRERGVPYLVLEHLPGGTLAKRLREQG